MPMVRSLMVAAALLAAGPAPAANVRIAAQDSGVAVRLRGISAVGADVAWASGREGTVLRTVDGGRHWQRMRVADADALDFRDVEGFTADSAVILGTGTGEASRVYRTDDGGKTWQLTLQNHDPRAFFNCMRFDGERGWMLGDPIDGRFQVYATEDGGRAWRLLPDGPPAETGEAAYAASGSCIARIDDALAIASGGTRSRLHIRRDGATAWTAIDSGMARDRDSAGVFSIAALPSGKGRRAGMIAVGGDHRAEQAAGNAIVLLPAGGAPPATRTGPRKRVAATPKSSDGFVAGQASATLRFLSAVACIDASGSCIATGPTGVDLWNGSAWLALPGAGYDAIDIKGKVGWLSGDAGRIAHVEIID